MQEKNRNTFNMTVSAEISPDKKTSKFSLLYNEAFREVKKKIPTQLENFPMIKLKTYSHLPESYPSIREQYNFSEQHYQSMNIFSAREQKTPTQIGNQATNTCLNKLSFSKASCEKKMSMGTLRIRSNSNKLMNSKFSRALSRETLRESFKSLNKKKLQETNSNEDTQNHFSILPFDLKISREEKEKFLVNKKKIEERFKITFLNDKEKKTNKINYIGKDKKNKNWEIEREDNEFVDFVKDKISSKF